MCGKFFCETVTFAGPPSASKHGAWLRFMGPVSHQSSYYHVCRVYYALNLWHTTWCDADEVENEACLRDVRRRRRREPVEVLWVVWGWRRNYVLMIRKKLTLYVDMCCVWIHDAIFELLIRSVVGVVRTYTTVGAKRATFPLFPVRVPAAFFPRFPFAGKCFIIKRATVTWLHPDIPSSGDQTCRRFACEWCF